MRIGILGGTFNPIHLGHLRAAEEIREIEQLDRVLLIPSATPPHKRSTDVLPAPVRLELVKLAIDGNPRFATSDIEIRREGASYSVDTLRTLRRRHPKARLVFVLGLDAFRDFATWREYREIFTLCDVAVVSRPPEDAVSQFARLLPVAARRDFCYQPGSNVLEHSSGFRLIFHRIPALNISATDIRKRVREGKSIRYLVPAPVERYIARRRLYAKDNPT